MSDDWDPLLNIRTMGNDWAIVELDKPIGAPDLFLPIRDQTPPIGQAVVLGGYSKDHIEELMADQQCHVDRLITDKEGLPLIHHDCTGTHGVSGAPLLVHDPRGWSIGGVDVVASSTSGGAATVLTMVRERVEKLR